MIAVINVEITAANPSMPLFPWRAYVNSPSSLRIRNVPRRVGNWNIDKVYVSAAYPDNSIKSAECVLVGGIWVCTIAGSTSTGFSQNGYTIYADGKDENGNDVTGYVLGKGDITILESDGTITPGENTYYVHMLSAQPTAPKDGDLWQLSGTWYIYQDGTSYPIGDDSGLIQQLSARVDGVETALSSKADISSTVLNPIYGGNGQKYSDWNFTITLTEQQKEQLDANSGGTASENNYAFSIRGNDLYVGNYNAALLEYSDNQMSAIYVNGDASLGLGEGAIVATRIENQIVGYKLGNQNDKPLQPQLSSPQISAIDSVVDERATVITFTDNTTSTFNWSGTITKYTMIDAGIFDGDANTWIKSPVSVKIGTTVTVIGDYAFGFADTLSSVTIPDSVTSIGQYAFYGCNRLTSVTIPDSVTSIWNSAFDGCTSLVNVKIIDDGQSLTIGSYAFYGCSSVPEITLPKNISTIGRDVFGNTSPALYLYFTEFWSSALIPTLPNYPWGVYNTSRIQNKRNATKEWVEEQGYGKDFAFAQGSVAIRPQRHVKLQPFTNTYLSLASGTAAFDVRPQGTAGTTAREMYFTLVLAGPMASVMTWNASCDVFEGGSAAAIAPKPNTTNIYHIFEYASGHFMVSKFSSALDELGDIETIVNAI